MPKHPGAGLFLVLLSAASFATSGVFATALNETGWSAGAAVMLRVSIGGLALAVPSIWMMRGQWHLLWRNIRLIVAYGMVAIAACQVCYFNALKTLTVGEGLLLEYLGLVMVVLWLWVRHQQRPAVTTMLGTVCAIVGLAFVLDLFGGSIALDVPGVLWALGSAVALAFYFVLSSRVDSGLPPLVLAGAGLLVGAIGIGLLSLVGLLPMQATTLDVVIGGAEVPWWLPVLGLALIAAALSYGSGIAGVRMLGATLGSFVTLSEVLFAVLFAWLFLGQWPAPVQLVGGAMIVIGVVLVRLGEIRAARARLPRPAAHSS